MRELVVGLDIGGTKTLGVAVDRSGDVVARTRRPSGHGSQAVVAGAVDAVERLVGDGDRLLGVGIGVPGLVDTESGVVAQALNLGLERTALAAEAAARLGVPVGIENDVNAAALGMAGGGDGSLAYLNLGTGLAAGIVVDGRLLRGARGAAGEIGHISVDPAGPPCVCGMRGCLEASASGSGIARRWPRRPFEVAELRDLAAAGDPVAARLAAELVEAVAHAVRVLVLAVDPARVVLGGGIAEALGAGLLAPVRDRLAAWQRDSAFLASLAPDERVELAPAGLPVAALGAAAVGLAAAERERAVSHG